MDITTIISNIFGVTIVSYEESYRRQVNMLVHRPRLPSQRNFLKWTITNLEMKQSPMVVRDCSKRLLKRNNRDGAKLQAQRTTTCTYQMLCTMAQIIQHIVQRYGHYRWR